MEVIDSEQPLVSVVVPIYKVEKYLRQCVDSILSQTLRNIEVILVDDGSPDGCPAIVDDYAAKDPRVVAIHQPNGGYGKAVNTGIARATAPYIGIIESDDWIEPTMYEKLYNRACETGAEVVKCMFWKYDSTAPSEEQDQLWILKAQDLRQAPDTSFAPTDWQPIFFFHASLWSNLYRADLLRQISFVETSGAAYQDFPFIMEVYARIRSMCIVKEPLLHYRMETGQDSSSMGFDRRLLRMVNMTVAARDVLERHGLLNKVREAFYFHAYLANIGFLEGIQDTYRQEYFDALHAVFAPLHRDKTFRWQFFNKKQRRKFAIIAAGGAVSRLQRRWKLSYHKGRLILRLAGKEWVWCRKSDLQ
ncbi:MAG: glycosyltransferase [Akkermansia sp.]|nr:glycosyltransferase [Akkermansia sp.]